MTEERRRADDSFIKVEKGVPLWTLLLAIVSVVSLVVNLQFGQNEQGKRIAELSSQIQLLNTNYASEIGSKIELKLKVERLEQRLTAIESRGKP